MSTLNFLAYMRANLVRVKAQLWRPAEKATLPLVGSHLDVADLLLVGDQGGDEHVDVLDVLDEGHEHVLVGSWSSRKARSSLFTVITGLMRSASAWRSTVSVCTHTPSTQSTTTSAPSVTRSAAVTSDEKSTWPGENDQVDTRPELVEKTAGDARERATGRSIWDMTACSARHRLGLEEERDAVRVDLMVMQRSCSSWRVSVSAGGNAPHQRALASLPRTRHHGCARAMVVAGLHRVRCGEGETGIGEWIGPRASAAEKVSDDTVQHIQAKLLHHAQDSSSQAVHCEVLERTAARRGGAGLSRRKSRGRVARQKRTPPSSPVPPRRRGPHARAIERRRTRCSPLKPPPRRRTRRAASRARSCARAPIRCCRPPTAPPGGSELQRLSPQASRAHLVMLPSAAEAQHRRGSAHAPLRGAPASTCHLNELGRPPR